MKDFYGRLQQKLDFISEPSSTAEDSRAKQAVADKLMRVLRQEEHKMTSSRLTTTDNPVILPTPRHFDSDNQASGAGPKRAFRSQALFLCNICMVFQAMWTIDFYPRLEKCHRRSQIFPVAFRRF